MADLARDASGPASSEPAGITQRVKQPASSDRKLRVFISYSRDDLKFANQLEAALNLCRFECLIDREGISGGEEWKRRLGNLISEADTVVFVLSPSSARSDTCTWEVEEAARLSKRILPVNCRPLEGVSPPPRLQERNYIFFYDEPKQLDSGFGTGLADLVTALNTDFDWLREHTRYLQRAMEWDAGGRPANRLLSGNDILDAKAWAARRPKSAPEPTALQLEFIRASEEEAEARLSERRKQLDAMAAAQAEREKALHDAEEALKQAADARRRRARVRNIALVVVSILAVLLGWSAEEQRKLAEQQRITATLAEQQKKTAEEQRQQADDILAHADNIIVNFGNRMDVKTQEEAFAVFQAGAEHGNAASMADLGYAYHDGIGVTEDYAKAREWNEKGAAAGSARAMISLAMSYQNGEGVTQDDAKARELYEKVIAQGERASPSMRSVAEAELDALSAKEAFLIGRYAEALQRREAFAAKVEAIETNPKLEGKPGKRTAHELNQVAWYALFAKDFPKALTVADRAHALLPDSLAIDAMRAHGLMFMGHDEEAKALYLAHKGEPVSEANNKLWEQAIAEDFANFRKAGLTHPMMADVEKALGISR
jgi:TPR repeat protein